MDDKTKLLKGSPSRDTFKQAHKSLSNSFYACDIDFVFVGNHPPGIIAFLDFKLPRDTVTFSEVLAYNDLLKLAPVYIVEASDPANGPFKVARYTRGVINAYPRPPTITLEPVGTFCNLAAFGEWERKIRNAARRGA